MFDKTYVKNDDGSITVWELDVFDRRRKAFSQRVSREVKDAFEFHGCKVVESDGWDVRPVNTYEREVVVEHVIVERSTDVPAAIGSFLGGLLRGARSR